MKSIGANQTKNDLNFLIRAFSKPGYDGKLCPDRDRKYQWAEIKSSALVKAVIHNDAAHTELVLFLRNILERIFAELNVNAESELVRYAKDLAKSVQKDKLDSYPVGQTKAFIDDPKAIHDNFYALYNFMKWVWYKLRHGDYYGANMCQTQPLMYHLVIQTFQQRLLIFQDMIRGDRLKLPTPYQLYDQIGITNINNTYLKRQVRGKPNLVIEPWAHPGQVECRVPYRGKYGTYMNEYAQENSFYASLQCGISGSTQYMLFMYLMSIANLNYTSDMAKRDIKNLILSATITLTGDGGHNVREVVFGLTTSITIMNTFIRDLNKNLQKELGVRGSLSENVAIIISQISINTWTSLPTFKQDLLNKFLRFIYSSLADVTCNTPITNPFGEVQKLFVDFLRYIANWKLFISTAYDILKPINVVGVTAKDLNKYDPQILANPKAAYTNYKTWLYDILFVSDASDMHSLYNYNNIQVFMALENDRYLMSPDESFKHAANNIMEFIISIMPGGADIDRIVDQFMLEINKQCSSPLDSGTVKKIPFAFPKRKSSKRKSPKRKSSKRKSPKRKSSKRKSSKRKSPKRKSPKRKSSKRKSPKRKSSKRKSPKRKSSKRKSPTRKSPKRKI